MHNAMTLTLSAWEFGMATLVHQGYLIVASSERIETTGKWAIWVGLFWSSNGDRQREVFNSLTDTFDTKDEAEAFGLQIAKDWISKHAPSPT
jgi:hypothetical protein